VLNEKPVAIRIHLDHPYEIALSVLQSGSRFPNRKATLGSGDKTVTQPKISRAVHAKKLFVECGKPDARLPFKLSQVTEGERCIALHTVEFIGAFLD
jgi:hypothetical protein